MLLDTDFSILAITTTWFVSRSTTIFVSTPPAASDYALPGASLAACGVVAHIVVFSIFHIFRSACYLLRVKWISASATLPVSVQTNDESEVARSGVFAYCCYPSLFGMPNLWVWVRLRA